MKKEGKRILSLILSLLMIISMQSFSMTMAFADDETGEITKQEAAAAETRKAAPESNEDQVEEQETTPGEEAQEPVMKKEPQAVDSLSGDENEPASDPAPEDEDKPATESASEQDAAPAAQMQPKSVKSSAALLGSEPTRNGNTVNMKVSSLGHGTVKVNGTDYGTEFKGTWPEGTEVSVEAVPDSGYKFNRWWIKSTPSNRRVTAASTTLVAGTDTEAEASFGRETASVTITAPAAGTTAATAPQVSMPSGVGYTLDTNTELHGPNVQWVKSSALYGRETLDSSTVFEAGQTYYAYVRLAEGTDSFAATAGGSSFNTELQVTGGTKSAQGNFAAVVSGNGYMGIEAVVAVTIPAATPSYELSFAFVNLYPTAQPQALVESLTVNGEDWTPTSGNITAKDIPAGSSVTATVKVTDNVSLASYNNPGNTIADLVPKYSDDFSEVTFTFTMPETNARIVVYLFEAVTVTYDANGGAKTDKWVDSVKMKKYTAFAPVPIDVSQTLYDLNGDLWIQPPAGATFAGIEVTQNKTGAKVTGKPGETIAVDFSEGGTIKFLWEKLPTLTLHASSVEGDDFVDPIVIPVEKGTTIAQALERYKSGTSLTTELFQVDGYEDYGYRTPKPMSAYSAYGELWDNNVSGSDTIEANLDIYYSMVKLIDAVEVAYEPPICGTSTTTEEDGPRWAWETQHHPPVTSLPGDANYGFDTTGGVNWSFWITDMENRDAYVGTFVGGEQYLAETWLQAKYGYTFSEDVTADVAGGMRVDIDYDGGYLGVYANITAVHDWGEWKVVKEPTTTEEGLEERACKHCDEKETRPIAKVVYSCTKGDGSVYTKGSGKDLKFTFERSYKDEETFIRAQKILVDGASVTESNYELSSGSLNVALMSDYLDTLAVGDHTITAVFNDAEVPAEFSVVEIPEEDTATDDTGSDKSAGKKTKSASTGDENDITSMIVLMLMSGIMMAYIGVKRRSEK